MTAQDRVFDCFPDAEVRTESGHLSARHRFSRLEAATGLFSLVPNSMPRNWAEAERRWRLGRMRRGFKVIRPLEWLRPVAGPSMRTRDWGRGLPCVAASSVPYVWVQSVSPRYRPARSAFLTMCFRRYHSCTDDQEIAPTFDVKACPETETSSQTTRGPVQEPPTVSVRMRSTTSSSRPDWAKCS